MKKLIGATARLLMVGAIGAYAADPIEGGRRPHGAPARNFHRHPWSFDQGNEGAQEPMPSYGNPGALQFVAPTRKTPFAGPRSS